MHGFKYRCSIVWIIEQSKKFSLDGKMAFENPRKIEKMMYDVSLNALSESSKVSKIYWQVHIELKKKSTSHFHTLYFNILVIVFDTPCRILLKGPSIYLDRIRNLSKIFHFLGTILCFLGHFNL